MFSIPDFVQPDYVDEMTFKERYAEDDDLGEESTFVQPWATYDPD